MQSICHVSVFFADNKIIYKGPDLEYTITKLHPYTPYSVKLRASTMGDDSPYSETVTVTTGRLKFRDLVEHLLKYDTSHPAPQHAEAYGDFVEYELA